MSIRRLVIFLMLYGYFACPAMTAEKEWEMIYDQDGIAGYEKSIPGTELKEYKATGFVESRMEVIGEILRDIPSYPEWMAKCKKAEVLKNIDRNTKIFFHETSTPLPASNRGAIIANSTKYDLDSGRAVIKFRSLDSEEFKKSKRLVYVTDLEGEFLLEFFGRDMTRVTYRYKVNPQGKVPPKFVNHQSRLFPVINIKGLRKMAQLEKYKKLGDASEEYTLIEKMIKDPVAGMAISKNRLREYFYKEELIDFLFKDGRLVTHVIKNNASFESIKYLVVDACSILIKDPEVRSQYRNKSLRDVVNVDKFYNDRVLTALFSKDEALISLILDDKDMLRKIMSDRILFGTILDSPSLAKTIANDQVLVNKLVADDEFINKIKSNSGLFKSPDDLKLMIEKRIVEYKNVLEAR